MTVTTDAKRRVVLPAATPGEVFQVSYPEPGKVLLIKMQPVEPKPPTVRLEKDERGYPVLLSDQPLDEAWARRFLQEEFP